MTLPLFLSSTGLRVGRLGPGSLQLRRNRHEPQLCGPQLRDVARHRAGDGPVQTHQSLLPHPGAVHVRGGLRKVHTHTHTHRRHTSVMFDQYQQHISSLSHKVPLQPASLIFLSDSNDLRGCGSNGSTFVFFINCENLEKLSKLPSKWILVS